MKKSGLRSGAAWALALAMAVTAMGCGNTGGSPSESSAPANVSEESNGTGNSETAEGSEAAGSSETAEGSEEAGSSEAAGGNTVKTEPKDISEVRLAAITGVSDEYWQLVTRGIQDACADAGLPEENLLLTTGATNTDIPNHVNTYLGQEVDAIVVTSSPDYNDVLKDASENGTYVGLIDWVEDQTFSAACYGYSHRMLGEAAAPTAADVIKENCDGKAKIHAIHLVQGSVVDERTNGFVDTLKELLGEENVELVSESSALDEQVAMQQTRDALTANPDINIVFSESILDGAGAYSAIDQLDMSGKVFNFTLEATIQACEQLADPDDPIYQGFAMMKPYENGYKLTERILKIATGEVTEYTPGEYTPMEVNVLTKKTPDAIKEQIETYESLLGS